MTPNSTNATRKIDNVVFRAIFRKSLLRSVANPVVVNDARAQRLRQCLRAIGGAGIHDDDFIDEIAQARGADMRDVWITGSSSGLVSSSGWPS